MKIKALLATATLVAVGSANAGIDTTGSTNGSELVFSAWDPVNQVSYSQDLGVNFDTMLSEFGNASYSLSFNVDPLFNTVFAGSNASEIVWNISAAKDVDFFNIPSTGVVFTAAGPIASTGVNSSAILNNIISSHNQYATNLNVNAVNGTADDIYSTQNPADIAYAGATSWNTNWGGFGSVDNSGKINDSLDFFHMALGSDFNSGAIQSEAVGDWVFNGSTIEYNNASVVPVPAAVWLLASGLIGFGTIARRRKNA